MNNLRGEQRKTLPTTRRVGRDKLPGFRMTHRDRAIIQAVYAYRAMTRSQVESLLFRPDGGQSQNTKTSRARHRLKMLYQLGYLYRDEQPTKLSEGRKPLVYFLDKMAIPLLGEAMGVSPGEIAWKRKDNNVTWLFLDHLLATNDVRIAVEIAATNNEHQVQQWIDDKALRSREMKTTVEVQDALGKLRTVSIVPDGYCCLRNNQGQIHLFLEVDRGTRTNEGRTFDGRTIARKKRGYLAYYKAGYYKERYGAELMTVLTVTTSQQRLANLKAVAEKIGGEKGDHFWFTTFDLVKPETILTEPIWAIAGRDGTYSIL